MFAEADYQAEQREVFPGDFIVLFTDGLYEVDNADGDELGEQRLRELLTKRMDTPPGEIFASLLCEIERFAAPGGFTDDVCLVGLEIK